MFNLVFWRRLTVVVFFLLFGWRLWRSLSQDPHLLPSTMVGKPVPAFHLSAMNHVDQMNQQIFKHHVSLLHVFASWCAVCQREQVTLLSYAQQVPHVQWVGLVYRDSLSSIRPWLKQLGNPYQVVLLDPAGELSDNMGVYGTPETFLVDSHGVIRQKWVGQLNQARWNKEVLPMINQLEHES